MRLGGSMTLGPDRADGCAHYAEAWNRPEHERDASFRQHCKRCTDCAAKAAAFRGLCAALASADATLDDVTRSRMLHRIVDASRGKRHAQTRAAWRWPAILGFAAVAAWLLFLGGREPSVTKGSLPAVAFAPVEVGTETGGPELATAGPSHFLDGTFSRLRVPARMRVRTRLGTRTSAVLVGPADIRVARVLHDAVELTLNEGQFVADHESGHGRGLRIRTPDAEIRVVGTVFSITAAPRGTTIAVTRGAVDVSRRGRVVRVSAGEVLNPDRAAPEPLLASERTSLFPHTPSEPLHQTAPAMPPAPPPVPPISATPAVSVKPTPEQLYQRAEWLMARGDGAAAMEVLADVTNRYPDSALAALAWTERAQYALARTQLDEARRFAAAARNHPRQPLMAAAAMLACRVEVADDRWKAAASCLQVYLDRFPAAGAAHEAHALLFELGLTHRELCPSLLDRAQAQVKTGDPLEASARRLIATCASGSPANGTTTRP